MIQPDASTSAATEHEQEAPAAPLHHNQPIQIPIEMVFPNESDENPSEGVQALQDTIEIIPLAPTFEVESDLATEILESLMAGASAANTQPETEDVTVWDRYAESAFRQEVPTTANKEKKIKKEAVNNAPCSDE